MSWTLSGSSLFSKHFCSTSIYISLEYNMTISSLLYLSVYQWDLFAGADFALDAPQEEVMLVFEGFFLGFLFVQKQGEHQEGCLQCCSSSSFLTDLLEPHLEKVEQMEKGSVWMASPLCLLSATPRLSPSSCQSPPGCLADEPPWSRHPSALASWQGLSGTAWTAACSCCCSSGAEWTCICALNCLRLIEKKWCCVY